ncbi:hypothetical protein J5N97_001408 [Dioscorea zingiberensis]|uniref:Uncharacterized protein n=1 Tax=Dioscorea zingiberensis TaxID=325984 RepID=A0A9D5BTW2_9LILI|nr:hypothetical protein J5N97_001408 [Dioscorea zingiberensis]
MRSLSRHDIARKVLPLKFSGDLKPTSVPLLLPTISVLLIKREIETLKILKDPTVVRLYEHCPLSSFNSPFWKINSVSPVWNNKSSLTGFIGAARF